MKSWDSITTGALSYGANHFYAMPGRLIQAVRNNVFLNQLATEFTELKDKGKIKQDYINTEQGKSCLQELLSALENPPVDEIRFNAFKSIFLKACTESISNREESTPILLMSIAKNMSGGAILLLAANYKVRDKLHPLDNQGYAAASKWFECIRAESDLDSDGLIEFYEEELIKAKLIFPRQPSRRDRVMVGSHSRLTDLGIKMSRYLLDE